MQKGKVKFWSSMKGYGFVVIEGKDYFCHYSEIKMEGNKNLRENQIVFVDDIGTGEKGQYCIGVSPAVPDPIKFEEKK